jgi:uncharacterized small protein (DUF1192 family)
MCPICLAAERDDLMKANALLHALIGNREAEIERLKADKDVIRSQERNAAYERDIAALEAEIERLRAVLKLGGATLSRFNVKNYHPTLVTLQAWLMAGLKQKEEA